ncbi:hypothetical protein JCM6882_001794 [Rhodosporidiobolus microsporus]
MDSSKPPHPPTPNERLEIPTLPPPSSRFVLPPPPSDLLNRLQAFLPQIRDANAMLEARGPRADGGAGGGEEEEEAVVMEEMSDSSDDSDDPSSDSSSDDDEDDSDDEVSDERAAATATAAGAQPEEGVEERGLAHLMAIGARPVVAKKKLLVLEEDEVKAAEAGEADKEKMEAD